MFMLPTIRPRMLLLLLLAISALHFQSTDGARLKPGAARYTRSNIASSRTVENAEDIMTALVDDNQIQASLCNEKDRTVKETVRLSLKWRSRRYKCNFTYWKNCESRCRMIDSCLREQGVNLGYSMCSSKSADEDSNSRKRVSHHHRPRCFRGAGCWRADEQMRIFTWPW